MADEQKRPLLHDQENHNYSSIPAVTTDEISVHVQNGEIIDSSASQQKDSVTHVYKRRWYMIVAFSCVGGGQGCLWNTWGPISDTSEHAFGWTDATIALFSNWGPIAYIFGAFFFSWFLERYGIRKSMLLTALLIALGAGIRCITDQLPYVTWTVHVGQLLVGLGGPISMGLPPALSSVWFPPHERTTATALATVLNAIGIASSFLLGPYLVPQRNTSQKNHNLTEIYSAPLTTPEFTYSFQNSSNSSSIIEEERRDIMKLMYIECGYTVFALLLVLIYFPEKPKIPPSTSASIERVNLKTGIFLLLKNGKFWFICLIYGLPSGVFNCWESVLDVNLKPHGISENEAGWIGFYSILASISALVVARFADTFARYMKLFLILMYVAAAICIAWFTVLVNGYIPNSVASLYISVILATVFLYAAPPLFFEMACEVTYPVSEGVTNLILTLMNNIGGLLFLLVQMIPNIGTAWENWSLLGSIVVCLPVMFVMKESYNRLAVDEN